MSEETNASSATESSVKEPAVTAADTQKKVVKKPSIGKYWTTLQKSLNSVLTKYVCVSCNFNSNKRKLSKNPSYVNISWMDLKEGGRAGGFRPPPPPIQICRKYGNPFPSHRKNFRIRTCTKKHEQLYSQIITILFASTCLLSVSVHMLSGLLLYDVAFKYHT